MTNQLRALLEARWPEAARLFENIDARNSLAFLDRFSTPRAAALLERLRTAPKAASRVSPEIVAVMVNTQIEQVRAIVEAIKGLESAIKEVLDAHPHAELFQALPRVGTVNLAQIIGEIGPMLERGLNAEQFAAEVGIAPVTRVGGKVHTVDFRHVANRAARKALHTFAGNSGHDDPWAADLYQRARDRGKRHPQTVRVLGGGRLRIIHARFRDRIPYDPAVHHSRHRSASAGP
ncbi:transposase [Actinoallomurus acaciae]|uniref:Transposase n=1 Tax=Actinoallomurus acaciae TaxID=502577 RepID=A0ABV5YMW3_9ACTN